MRQGRTLATLLTAVVGSLLAMTGSAAAAPAISEYTLPQSGSQPISLDTGADGALWFTESGANKIGRITTGGTISQFAIPTASSTPQGLGAGPDGNVWFAEAGTSKIARVTPTGTITEFPTTTASAGPDDVVAGADGNLWFTEASVGKVGRITPTGTVTEFSTSSSTSQPEGIAAGPDGNLWFAETSAGKIGRATPTGTVTEFPLPSSSAQPTDMIAGPDGALWFTEYAANKIGRITTSGVVTEFPVSTPFSAPLSIAVGPDGNLWFTEKNSGRIGSITTAGAMSEYQVPTFVPALEDVVSGPDGRMWFAEWNGNKVGALAIPPSVTTGSATGVDTANATLAGTIAANGQTVSYHFDYGTTGLYGQSTGTQSVSGSGPLPVALPVSGLAPSTTNHYRVVATSAGGTVTGADQVFTTSAAPQQDTNPPGTNGVIPDPTAALRPVIVLPKAVTVTANGQVPLQMACPAQAVEGCTGTLVLTLLGRAPAKHRKATVEAARCGRGCRPLGSRRYQLGAGRRGHLSIRLTLSAIQLLKRQGSLKAQLTITARAGSKTAVTHRIVTLHARRRRGGR